MSRFQSYAGACCVAASLAVVQMATAADFGTPVIDIVDASTLKGVKRVAVTSFTVQYVTSQVWDTSYTTGGGPGNRTGNLQFVGQGGGFDVGSALDPAKMQSTTDKLYQGFLTDLQGAGFDVVSAEQLVNSKAFKAYAANGPATPRKEEAEAQKSNGAGAITSVFYTPPGVPLVLGDKIDHLSAGTFGSNVGDPTLTFAGRLSLYTTRHVQQHARLHTGVSCRTGDNARTIRLRLTPFLAIQYRDASPHG